MDKLTPNVMMSATQMVKEDGRKVFSVSVKGLGDNISAVREFTDQKDAFACLQDIQKRLNLELNNVDVYATSLAYKNAIELAAKAEADKKAAIEETMKVLNDAVAPKANDAVAQETKQDKPVEPMEIEFTDEPESETTPEPEKIEVSGDSPIMKQWNDLKKKHPDALLLFRCADFYETYNDDAKDASQILGITLTRRNTGTGKRLEMAGFPYHALDTYLPKLIRAGKRVAICDQIEEPKKTAKTVSINEKIKAS